MENFTLFYTSLNTGAVEPDGYTLLADGSNEGAAFNNVRDLAYDPTGSRIAFIRNVDVEGTPVPQVFIADADNPDTATQLTTLTAPDTAHPSFSPDGSLIVFSSSADSESEEIYLMNADGSGLRRLTENTWIDRDPAFSPLSNLLVFTSDQDSPLQTELYTLTLPDTPDGEAVITRLTNTGGSNYSASWSQDGRYIVFASDRAGAADIYRIEVALGGTGDLMTLGDGDAENRRPAISPDGRYIAYISNRDSATFQTYLLDLDTREVRQLTNNEREDISVVFRPVPLSLLSLSSGTPTFTP